jgi:Xaa-Pro aminopeptidase
MINQELQRRRSKLLSHLDSKSIVIIFAAPRCICGNNEYHRRQNSDFYYLTGFPEQDAIAILNPNHKSGIWILFRHKKDPFKELWHGLSIDRKEIYSKFKTNHVFDLEVVDQILPKILTKYKNIYSNANFSQYCNHKLKSWLQLTRVKNKLFDLSDILAEMRLRKSAAELAIMRRAIDITSHGYLRAMKQCRPGMYEFELEAEIRYEFNRLGGRNMAYEPIIAGGINACTLHYSKNDRKLHSGDLVLIDAGVEYGHYAADVSRTLPVNGKFTKEQRIIYEIVLTAQIEIIKMIRPGISWEKMQNTAERVLTEGLKDIGLLEGSTTFLLEKQAYRPFFMHRIGHWLGMDTHDVGSYGFNNISRFLEPNMVLTVEPGIYISSKTIGIRIEDDILVTDNGAEILTSAIPKNVSEIEKTMRQI